MAPTKLPAHPAEDGDGVQQGSFTAPRDGVCTLTWDNAYSRFRGKQVLRALLMCAPTGLGARPHPVAMSFAEG
jgi:hypothetical protein